MVAGATAAGIKSACRSDDIVSMERRREERYEVRFETKVSVRGQAVLGRVSNISESGISVDLPFQLSAGDMAQLELADSTIYGHVVYSDKEGDYFRTGIHASRVALGRTSLSGLLQRVLMETLPLTPGVEPHSEVYPG
jgi:PilZ domain